MPSNAREGMLAMVILILRVRILSTSNRELFTESQKKRKKNEPEGSFFQSLVSLRLFAAVDHVLDQRFDVVVVTSKAKTFGRHVVDAGDCICDYLIHALLESRCPCVGIAWSNFWRACSTTAVACEAGCHVSRFGIEAVAHLGKFSRLLRVGEAS